MWVSPDTDGLAPSYEQVDVNDQLASGGLVPIASGQGHEGAVRIHQRDAVLWGARVSAGASVRIPDGGHVHVFLAVGAGDLADAGALVEGDAVRLAAAGERTFVAGGDGAEVLVWVTA
jgi:redox-sensitive bicupin YhaK (pirin superfamily)